MHQNDYEISNNIVFRPVDSRSGVKKRLYSIVSCFPGLRTLKTLIYIKPLLLQYNSKVTWKKIKLNIFLFT